MRVALICLAATIAVALLVPGRAAPAGGVVAAQATPTPVYPIPTPTPTATPTPAPTASLSLLIVAVHAPALHGRRLAWSVRCLPHACHALLVLRVKIGRKGRARRLATVRRRVPSTRARRIAVRISRREARAVRRAWRHHRRVFADLRGSATDGHNTASFRLHTRLRRPRR